MGALEPYRGGMPGRQSSRALDRLGRELVLRRAADQARAELAAARISDIDKVTRHGVAATTHIALDAQLAAEAAPWAAGDIARIARRGMGAIEREVDKLADPWG